jgi:pectinesterase
MKRLAWLLAIAWVAAGNLMGTETPTFPKPDIVVAADGSGQFRSVQAALASLPQTNRERMVVFVKDGTYHEKVKVDASFVTLRGQSRKGTRIEFAQLEDDFKKQPDNVGKAVLNINKVTDIVLENLTIANTATDLTLHAFAIHSLGDRTVILNCDGLSEGADTIAMWRTPKGFYYHANCHFRGASDYVCPRGWCYATNCTFYGTKRTGSATWHDGGHDPDKKFVLRGCSFDGVDGWRLGRHQLDAQVFYLDCAFSKTMEDRPPFRVAYAEDPRKTAEVNSDILWGERFYFLNCHRDGGDYDWHRDNLMTATNAVPAEEMTAAWTFAGEWDPERTTGPAITRIAHDGQRLRVGFNEPVTVKGKPRLRLKSGTAEYLRGSGTTGLVFSLPGTGEAEVLALELNGATIIACQAGTSLRPASLALPAANARK